MKKILALMLALAMIFAFAACKDNAPDASDESTTVADAAGENVDDETDAAVAENSTVPATDENGLTISADETEDSTADAEDSTAANAVTINAPVNGSKADIVNFFNQYATAMKKYTGKVTVKRVQGTTSKINNMNPAKIIGVDLIELAEPLLPNDYPQTETKTFNGGKASDGTTIASFLPADDLAAYNVPVAGVKTASCTKQGNGWKVSITLVSESGTGLQYVPKYHGACFDTLALTEDDFSPFKPASTTVNYQSGTYSFVLDASGRITSIIVSEPANVVCKLTFGGTSVGIDADFTGTWKQEYTITY